MKRILYFLPVFVLLVLFSQTVTAQVSASSEPRAQVSASGEMIIMPFIPPVSEALAVATPKPSRKAVVRVSKSRKNGLKKRQNGYFQMNSNQDWGTNYRLGHYGLAKLN